MNVLKCLFIIGFTQSLWNPCEAGRRNAESDHNPATINFPEKIIVEKPEYDVLQASQNLHREALKAFHLSAYADARACFSLALKASPRSENSILDYALFSMVVPWAEGQSLSRAEGLLKQLTSERSHLDPRFDLAQAIFNWQKGDSIKSLEILSQIPKDSSYSDLAQDLEKHLAAGGELVNLYWAKNILPQRESPRKKRSHR